MMVRQYRPADRQAVREISYLTSMEGRAPDFMDAREILEDALTVYFTDYAPEWCFLAEENGRVIGYLLGTGDVKTMRRVMSARILPRLAGKIIRQGILLRKKNLLFFWNYFLGFCRGEFGRPCFDRDFPATFHLNISEGFRNQGIGTALVDRNLSSLQEKKIPGVHIGTMSEQAKDFFLKLGFEVLFCSRRSYLRYILGRDMPYYILGKKLYTAFQKNGH